MKTAKAFKNGNTSISNSISPHHGLNKRDIDAEDEDADGENEDDDDDEENGPLNTTNSPPIDSCLASHEFEWLKPSSPIIPTVQVETVDQQSQVNTSRERLNQTPSTCTSVPSHLPPHKSKKSSSHQRRTKDHDYLSCRMSPTLCYDSHNCRHRMSPMRSSWCCPSPPPPPNHAAVCLNHSGISVSGMEIMPIGQECCPEEYTYGLPCYCLPPLPGRSHIRHYSACTCPHASPAYDYSPASPQQTYRNSLQRSSQAVGSRRREFSPSSSPLHRSYCPSEVSHSTYPAKSTSNIWEEQWRSPLHSDDVGSFQKIQQLESDKQNLLLQVSVLNEQIEAQKEKIKELEEIIEEKSNQIKELRKEFHQEKLSKAAVENEKLDLLTDISGLRQQLTIADRERRESEERCRRIEGELEYIAERVGCTDAEHSSRKMRSNPGIGITNETGFELEKLRRALDSVIASNEEKDTRIEYLRTALVKYKKLQEFVLTGHQRKLSDGVKEIPSGETADVNLIFKSSSILEPQKSHSSTKSIIKTCSHSTCAETSSTSHCEADCLSARNVPLCGEQQKNCPPSTVNRSNSLENIHASASKFTLPKCSYGTVPRQNGPQVLEQLQEQLQSYEQNESTANNACPDAIDRVPVTDKKTSQEVMASSRNKSTGVSFGKGFFKLRSGKRSSSAPELAPNESVTILSVERDYSSACPTPQPTMQPFLKSDRNKGFRKFFTRWKRSGLQNVDKYEEFRRGGIRATAGPRLGWSHDISADPDIPFPRWTNDFVVDWMNKIGLTMYISEIKRWRCNGEQFLNSTTQEIEKHLNMKNLMHKKKLQLALQGLKSETLPASINSMDYLWVIRWLDDVGLPQYKDSFSEARVDGRVLHYLTVDDLLILKVTNQLHHVSIKRGIQLLREKNFDPHCLIRRSLPEEDKDYKPEFVAMWTNHRVMEWLRTVDLSEYAPNLRGSGVHGALIVYEPKFNTDLFASLLNIPPTKTLLRRHLATHFKAIIGNDLAQTKRDLETDELYTPLTPNIKIKGIRKTQFSLKKKKGKVETEGDEFVCPMDIPVGSELIKPDGDKLIVRRNSDPAPQEKTLDIEDEKTAEEIGAVSKEITSLTSLLQEEKLLKNSPSTNV